MNETLTKNPLLLAADRLGNLLAKALTHIEEQHVHTRESLNDALLALETLPLPTAEFALAQNRLCNAAAYIHAAEWGAARYEINLLLRWLGGHRHWLLHSHHL